MTDRYLELANTAVGRQLFSRLNLPAPPELERAAAAYATQPFSGVGATLGAVDGALFTEAIEAALREAGAEFARGNGAAEPQPAALLVFDASGAANADALKGLYAFFHARVGTLKRNARIVVVGRAIESCLTPNEAAAAGALSGFVKSLAKEIGRKGATANLLTVADGAQVWIAGALRFLLSGHAAYITGQVLPLTKTALGVPPNGFEQTLAGKTALVTGAARGIGAAIACTLAREGAKVIGVDHPSQEGALAETLSGIKGRGLALDVTAADTPARLASELGPLDIVVHNAGITRDKLLRNMREEHWDAVLNVNLGAILRINERLLDGGLKAQARMICIASIGGIAGNTGQCNYAATKSGVIGYCRALAPQLAQRGMAINAVAPGFIETQMTAAVPPVNRFVGRRMAALLQGGLPEDIAEAVTFLASVPLSGGVNGATLRVCGQNWLGA